MIFGRAYATHMHEENANSNRDGEAIRLGDANVEEHIIGCRVD